MYESAWMSLHLQLYSVAHCINNSQSLQLICPKWTGPDQARTSLPEFWTGPIPVQTLVQLDAHCTGLDQSRLVHTRTTGIIDRVFNYQTYFLHALQLTISMNVESVFYL